MISAPNAVKNKAKHSGRAYQCFNHAQRHDSVARDKISGEYEVHAACRTILTGAGKLAKWNGLRLKVILCVLSKNVSGNY